MRAVAAAVAEREGGLFVWTFSRQAGKDESIAQLLVYLGIRYHLRGGSIIVAAPTQTPQADQMQTRLLERLHANALTRRMTRSRDNTVWCGRVRYQFMSSHPDANQRGETASLLLVGNEAQDIDPQIWQSRFAPMTASTNAPTLLSGTVWDTQGMLHQGMAALERTAPDHLFRVPWSDVAPHSPDYARHCRLRLDELGIDHPYWLTEYELRPLDMAAGLFPDTRRSQFEGAHDQLSRGIDGERYAFLIDVAGEEETSETAEAYDTGAKRDSTTLFVLRCVDTVGQPRFEIVQRRGWTGIRYSRLLDQIEDLAVNVWRAEYIVIDATGIGAGLASFMADRFKRKRVTIVPHLWTFATKSQAGFDLVSLIDTGRLKDYRIPTGDLASRELYSQMIKVKTEIMPGTKQMRWSVPAHLGHDDELMALALTPALDAVYAPRRVARAS